MIQVTLAFLARRQMNGQLATEHAQTVGRLECILSRSRIRELNVGIVVLFECALDYLAVSAEQVLYLTLCASKWKICNVEFSRYDSILLYIVTAARVHCITIVGLHHLHRLLLMMMMLHLMMLLLLLLLLMLL